LVHGKFFHAVTVSDNGVGFGPDRKTKEGLGLRIAQTTVREKVYGNMHRHSDAGGTVVSFDIKNETM